MAELVSAPNSRVVSNIWKLWSVGSSPDTDRHLSHILSLQLVTPEWPNPPSPLYQQPYLPSFSTPTQPQKTVLRKGNVLLCLATRASELYIPKLRWGRECGLLPASGMNATKIEQLISHVEHDSLSFSMGELVSPPNSTVASNMRKLWSVDSSLDEDRHSSLKHRPYITVLSMLRM